MATLRELIESEVSKLEAEQADINAKFEADSAAIVGKIEASKAKLSTFGAWIEHEVTTAKAEIEEFFSSFGL